MPTMTAEPTRLRVATARPRILHFQHYNAVLQHAVLEAERIDADRILEQAAAEVVYQSLLDTAGWAAQSEEERRAAVAALFLESGLGGVDLAAVGGDGGTAVVAESSFAVGWVLRYGKPSRPVCTVAAGYLRGALTAVYERSYRVVETDCRARSVGRCRFSVVALPDAVDLLDDEAAAVPPAGEAPLPRTGAVDESEVARALFGDGPVADSVGRIGAFGTSLTRFWGDFYARVSFRFEREVPRVMGTKFTNLASILLTEAGHACAFHSLGTVLRSDEWHERVAPGLKSSEDWVHALAAVVNALGWGVWRIHGLVGGERLSVRVYDSYEAIGYRRLYGRSESPRCYLARGAAGAIMNLVYVGDPAAREELTPSLYNRLFRSPLSFRAVETRCRAMDDPYCELVVNPLSPALRRW